MLAERLVRGFSDPSVLRFGDPTQAGLGQRVAIRGQRADRGNPQFHCEPSKVLLVCVLGDHTQDCYGSRASDRPERLDCSASRRILVFLIGLDELDEWSDCWAPDAYKDARGDLLVAFIPGLQQVKHWLDRDAPHAREDVGGDFADKRIVEAGQQLRPGPLWDPQDELDELVSIVAIPLGKRPQEIVDRFDVTPLGEDPGSR